MAELRREDWLQAQYSVLGSVLLSPELAPKIIAETGEGDYQGPNQTVYRAIKKLFLAGSPVDVVSVAAALGPDYREHLAQLMDVTPTSANVDLYIKLCREQARVVKVKELAQQVSTMDDWEKMRDILEKINGMTVDRPALKISTMADSLRSFMDRHTRQTNYLTWPVKELNEMLYAELGDLVIIGGYPSSGKSAWALQCAWHWAKNYKVGFFSLETSSEKLFDRQMSAVAELSMDDIKRNTISREGWDKVCQMAEAITARNLELVPAAGMTPADVRAVTTMRGYQIIFIDYLQLLSGSGDNRTAQVTSISIALHTLAQSMGVTVVALSQLSRQPQQQKNQPPDMSSLRESGQIEQDADLIMILSLADKEKPSGERDLRVRKNKEGLCPSIRLCFDGKHQTFSKAQRTGDVLSKLTADGRKIKRQSKQAAQNPDQMAMLPNDYPVPF